MQDIIFPKHKKELIESLHGRPKLPIIGGAPSRGPKFKRYLKVAGALVAVYLVAWVIISYASRAEIIITPHREAVVFDDLIIASRASSTPTDTVGFQIMTVKDEANASISATKSESVTTKATGVVILYNRTATSQKLVARTRLEATGGKLYRIISNVTVPGAKTVSGKLTPGSIETKIEAALPGADYNGGLTDFTIPGFKNSAKFSQFYGRSKTATEGGLIGTRLIASEQELADARVKLKKTLADSLAKKAVESIPPGWIMYKDGTFLDLAEKTDQKQTDGDSKGTVTLTESGALRAVILNEEDLRAYTINHKLKNKDAASYHVKDLNTLEFAIVNKNNFAVNSSETFTFSLKGNTSLVADIPAEPLTADLLNKAYSERAKVFRKYSGIETAEVKLFPGFISSFPSDKDRISVKVKQADSPAP
ncbi:MAG: hypothetical protein WC764_00085 [Candidatus Paceibacterota bacterium]|jgi:hypothetical protein